MKILKRTPRTDMHLRSLARKCISLPTELAQQMGVEEKAVDEELYSFLRLSIRVQPDKDEFDFAFAQGADAAETIAEKFIRYLDTQCVDRVDEAWIEMGKIDAPSDPATAPTPPEDDKRGE